jgi:phosphoribosyl-ATP pyrophosphohydrolase
MSSYAEVELEICRWGERTKIIGNGTAMGQAIKTAEEVTELLKAINKGNKEEIVDAIGDIGVTLLMQCAIQDVNFTDCLYAANKIIQQRKGHLGADGIFYKQGN